MAAKNKIKLTWEKEIVFLTSNGLPCFLNYSQGYLRSLPNQVINQQYTFDECMRSLSGTECFETFCTLGYCLVDIAT